MRREYLYISVICAIVISGCTKPFNPPGGATNANILVVEGLVNTGTDSTIIKLSRTVIVANKTTANAETKAIITVENAQGTAGTLTESVKGTYVAPPLKLDNTKQYRLRIKTSNGKTYLSDLVDAKVAPPIDSIGFTVTGTGLQIYANAHDATNNTRYYKYSYSEAWQFHAQIYAGFTGDGKKDVTSRTPSQDFYICFGSDSSANTVLNSTQALSNDIVYQFPIVEIASSAEKIETKYSILVSQQALTKDAYDFWVNLQKNTEQLGSIFDAQPSQSPTNIHNINDASEPVIGFISAGTTQKKRIFITRAQLPQGWQVTYPDGCGLDSAYYSTPMLPHTNTVVQFGLTVIGSWVVNPFGDYGGGWMFTTRQCADCTLRGTKTQPAFWK